MTRERPTTSIPAEGPEAAQESRTASEPLSGAPPETGEARTPGALPPDPSAGRLVSLDAFRGLAIAGMILVNNPGSWGHIYGPLRHAAWHGWTPTDLIFPFFLFIVGVAIPFSFARRLGEGADRRRLSLHVFRRSAVLFLLGLGLHGFPGYDLSTLRIMGVLQRIALVYLAAAALYLWVGRRGRAGVSAALLLGYWALMTRVPVPGYGAGDLSPEGNLAGWVDRALLEGHLWSQSAHWGDPEGLLSTLPAVVTCLLGIFAGEWLRSGAAENRKVVGLAAAGAAGWSAGWLWGLAFPVNKQLWTSSYVLLTAGIALLLLAAFYHVIDVRRSRRWAFPLVVYGMNAITVFVASSLIARVLVMVRVGEGEGDGIALKTWLYERLFLSWADPVNASLAFAVAYVLAWLGVVWWLHRRRIFLKV